mmetsp:Transcript_26966/g.42125  ORF Transcript_26966/g.42125 Transcript_26966/m.42125 type:complete len:183 (-) Transcript_26966:34-582(-)
MTKKQKLGILLQQSYDLVTAVEKSDRAPAQEIVWSLKSDLVAYKKIERMFVESFEAKGYLIMSQAIKTLESRGTQLLSFDEVVEILFKILDTPIPTSDTPDSAAVRSPLYSSGVRISAKPVAAVVNGVVTPTPESPARKSGRGPSGVLLGGSSQYIDSLEAQFGTPRRVESSSTTKGPTGWA